MIKKWAGFFSLIFLASAGFALASPVVEEGARLFSGEKSFVRGGPSCLSCHSGVETAVPGGKLGPSLSKVAESFSKQELKEFLLGDDSPVMAAAYQGRALTEAEAEAVATYLLSGVTREDEKSKKAFFISLLIAGVLLAATYIFTAGSKV